jgi:hypothetical protein
MFESLDDSVDVLTVYVDGRVEPLRFRWKGRVIRVRRVTGRWSRREGQTVLRYFAVEAEPGATYELRYDPRGSRWQLSRAWVAE